MTHKLRGWLLGAFIGLAPVAPANACAFHGYTPNPTLVDVLLATEQVLIARPDPSDPRRYALVETLAGPDISNIPTAVSQDARIHIADRPDATVLLARDGAYGPWLEVAVLDARYRALVTRVLQRQSSWAFGGDQDRLRHFAGLVNDPNPDIRELALRELDRAPYGTLRNTRLPKVQNLKRDLSRYDDELTPIRVLLAGLSRDRSFGPILSAQLETAIRQQTPYLGAYVTALIELEGQQAVQTVLAHHLKNERLSIETKEKILQALAIQHKTAPAGTRRAIASGVSDLLRSAPELREAAGRQFAYRSHWSLRNPAPGADR